MIAIRPKLAALALGLTLALVLPTPVRAEEEGAGREELQAKIKKKMEEILELMSENERALLELSTGSRSKPRRVDVDVPVPEGSSKGSGEAGSGPVKGEDIARRLRELIEGQRGRGERIPKEIEALLKMIPKSQGQGQGQPQDNRGKSKGQGDKTSQELRDARKKLEEEQRGSKQGSKPERGDKSDPAQSDKMRTGKPEGPEKAGEAKRDSKVPAWFTSLPPEIRDALAGGQAEKIPSKYRHLIARYNLYLQKGSARKGR